MTKTTNRLDYQDATNVDSKGIAFTIRSVFIIDPNKKIRTILSYPASTGRNTAEVLRIVDSLQTGDKHKVTTPINWVPGDGKSGCKRVAGAWLTAHGRCYCGTFGQQRAGEADVPEFQSHQTISTNDGTAEGGGGVGNDTRREETAVG